MSYNPVNWANGEEGGTPMSASNLNRMDKGIAEAHEILADHDKKIDDFVKGQIPEEYVKGAVDDYISENQAGLASKEVVEEVAEEVGALSSEIVDKTKQISDTLVDVNVFPSFNLFNKYSHEIEKGGYYDNKNQWVANDTMESSGFIPCKANDEFRHAYVLDGVVTENSYNTLLTFYDSNKNYVSVKVFTANSTRFTIPSNEDIAFFRMPIPLKYKETKMVFKYAELPNEFVPYNGLNNIMEQIYIQPFNLYNKYDSDIEEGGFYDRTNTWVSNTDQSESGYIPCKAGDVFRHAYLLEGVVTENSYNTQATFYDANKNYVSGFAGTSASDRLTIPNNSNIAYFRMPIPLRYRDTKMIFKYGNLPNGYVAFIGFDEKSNAELWNVATERIAELEKQVAYYAENDGANHWYGKKWYAYGTSITDVGAGTGKYVPYLAEFSGMNAVDKGIGGGGITDLGAFSTGQVKRAIMNITDGKTEADLITLEVGPNDTNDINLLGTPFDLTDETYCGCLNQCLQYLQINTDAQIVVIDSVDNTQTDFDSESKRGKYEQRKLTEECCRVNRIPYIKSETNMGYAKLTSHDQYLVDTTHHTELGGYVMAKDIWSKLKNIPLFYAELPS